DAPKGHEGIPCGLTQCRMDAPLPCPAGGGAEVVTPGLVTVSLGKRPMQSADTSHGTSVAGREPGGAPSGPPSGGHFQRNSDAVIPKARSRAARLCLGGSESRNRLSGGDPAWPAFCVGWTHNRSRPMKRLALALCLAALAAPPLDAQGAPPAPQTGASAADSEWTLVEATDWPTRARGLIGKRV